LTTGEIDLLNLLCNKSELNIRQEYETLFTWQHFIWIPRKI